MATSKTLAPTNVTISIPAMTDQPNASVLANCADKEADAINALNSQISTITQEYIAFTDSNDHTVNIYFRVWNNVLSVLMNSDYAMILPTTWTAIGSLTSIRPQSDRYIPFLCPGGGSGVIRIYADGGVRIYGNQSTAVWLQTSGSVVFK